MDAPFEMDVERGMHAEQKYVFHAPPPRAGTRLRCQSRIAEIYETEGRRDGTMTFVVMVTEFRDASGRLVAEARSLTANDRGGNRRVAVEGAGHG